MNPELLELPWKIQVALASGFAAYSLAYFGIRGHHKTIDVAFKVLLFSLVATAILELSDRLVPIVAGAAAFFGTIVVGLFWRCIGIDVLLWFLRRLDISLSDDQPTAWTTMIHRRGVMVTQIAVELDDGTWLRCDDTARFSHMPLGPAILGHTGDLGLCLTHEERPGEPVKELESVDHPAFGSRMTYVPVSRIKQITMRYKKDASRSSKAAESLGSSAVES